MVFLGQRYLCDLQSIIFCNCSERDHNRFLGRNKSGGINNNLHLFKHTTNITCGNLPARKHLTWLISLQNQQASLCCKITGHEQMLVSHSINQFSDSAFVI